jgi:fluoroacetyl-CoA thioesterase
MDWPIGASSIFVRKVSKEHLASAWGNDVDVLATPILLWLSELACIKVVEGYLPAGSMTVGYRHDTKHLAATPEHFTIEIKATLLKVDGKILLFSVQGTDGKDEILLGEHSRAVIDADKFRTKVHEKAAGSTPKTNGKTLT